jgi:hypothetical protein
MTGKELDLLYPFEVVEPVMHELRPDRAAPLRNWLVYHQAFLRASTWSPRALAVQPGRLRIGPTSSSPSWGFHEPRPAPPGNGVGLEKRYKPAS